MKTLNLVRWLYLAALASGLSGDDATIETTMNLDPDLGLPFINIQIALAQSVLEGKSQNAKPLYRLPLSLSR